MTINQQHIIFDLDDTLVNKWTYDLLPEREETCQRLRTKGKKLYLATNQGGPAYYEYYKLRRDKRAKEYPTLLQEMNRINTIRKKLNIIAAWVALHPGDEEIRRAVTTTTEIAANQLSKHNKSIFLSFDPNWRKPAGDMLKSIIEIKELTAKDCLYVGDSTDDFQASRAAGIKFMDESCFFDQ